MRPHGNNLPPNITACGLAPVPSAHGAPSRPTQSPHAQHIAPHPGQPIPTTQIMQPGTGPGRPNLASSAGMRPQIVHPDSHRFHTMHQRPPLTPNPQTQRMTSAPQLAVNNNSMSTYNLAHHDQSRISHTQMSNHDTITLPTTSIASNSIPMQIQHPQAKAGPHMQFVTHATQASHGPMTGRQQLQHRNLPEGQIRPLQQPQAHIAALPSNLQRIHSPASQTPSRSSSMNSASSAKAAIAQRPSPQHVQSSQSPSPQRPIVQAKVSQQIPLSKLVHPNRNGSQTQSNQIQQNHMQYAHHKPPAGNSIDVQRQSSHPGSQVMRPQAPQSVPPGNFKKQMSDSYSSSSSAPQAPSPAQFSSTPTQHNSNNMQSSQCQSNKTVMSNVVGGLRSSDALRPSINQFLQESRTSNSETADASYIECSLSGLIDINASSESGKQLMQALELATDVKLLCTWKDECWRQQIGNQSYNFMASNSSSCNEIWLRRYSLPLNLRDMMCVRMYTLMHQSQLSNCPTMIKHVRESTVSPSFLSILSGLGFRKNQANDVYVKCQMFHVQSGSPDHCIVLVQKHFKDAETTKEMFHGKYMIEIKGRSETEESVDRVSNGVAEFAKQFKNFVDFEKR